MATVAWSPDGRRLATVGFDWDSAERVLEKVAEEAGEIVAARAAGAPQDELEGEIGDSMYVILSGQAEVMRSTDGTDIRLAVLGKGDIVGEMEKAVRKRGMKFITTLHHSWLWGW